MLLPCLSLYLETWWGPGGEQKCSGKSLESSTPGVLNFHRHPGYRLLDILNSFPNSLLALYYTAAKMPEKFDPEKAENLEDVRYPSPSLSL